MKKESVFKKIFSTNKDCCSIEFEEVEDNEESDQDAPIHNESSCRSSKTE